MEEITLEEFDKRYNQPDGSWRFDLFKIACAKCGSLDVEYNGSMETRGEYYGDASVFSLLVVKCHGCGNAFAMKDHEYVSGCSDCDR